MKLETTYQKKNCLPRFLGDFGKNYDIEVTNLVRDYATTCSYSILKVDFKASLDNTKSEDIEMNTCFYIGDECISIHGSSELTADEIKQQFLNYDKNDNDGMHTFSMYTSKFLAKFLLERIVTQENLDTLVEKEKQNEFTLVIQMLKDLSKKVDRMDFEPNYCGPVI